MFPQLELKPVEVVPSQKYGFRSAFNPYQALPEASGAAEIVFTVFPVTTFWTKLACVS
jgi:hypothetical protein